MRINRDKVARIAAYVLVVVVAALAVYRVTEGQIDRENQAALATCARVQILRDQANGLNFLTYRADVSALRRERALAKGPDGMAHHKSVKALSKVVHTLLVTGPTNCQGAVFSPETYRAPAPEFVYTNSPNVRVARKRANRLIIKARTKAPLYGPNSITRFP